MGSDGHRREGQNLFVTRPHKKASSVLSRVRRTWSCIRLHIIILDRLISRSRPVFSIALLNSETSKSKLGFM